MSMGQFTIFIQIPCNTILENVSINSYLVILKYTICPSWSYWMIFFLSRGVLDRETYVGILKGITTSVTTQEKERNSITFWTLIEELVKM